MEIKDMSLETFQGLEGTIYDVYVEKDFQFKMELIEVKAEKPHPKPKWEPMISYRLNPFSLFFESDRKIHLRKNMIVNGGVFEFAPFKIEAIAESKKGYIYQAVIG